MSTNDLSKIGSDLIERDLTMMIFPTPSGFCVWLFARDDPELGVFMGAHADPAKAYGAALAQWDAFVLEAEAEDSKPGETN